MNLELTLIEMYSHEDIIRERYELVHYISSKYTKYAGQVFDDYYNDYCESIFIMYAYKSNLTILAIIDSLLQYNIERGDKNDKERNSNEHPCSN